MSQRGNDAWLIHELIILSFLMKAWKVI